MDKSVEVRITMIKVRNKKVISEVAKTTYKANMKRNILTILAICITTFLITVVVALGFSYWDTISTRQIRMAGMDYDIELSEPLEAQVEKLRSMDEVKYAGLEVKSGIATTYKDISLELMRLYWVDDICWNEQCIPAFEYCEGTYPKKENEVMISKAALETMGISEPKLGMSIPLEFYYMSEENTNEETTQKEFQLSGYYKDYSGNEQMYVSEAFYKKSGVKQTDFTQGKLKITLKNSLYSEADILKMQSDINLSERQVLTADYETIKTFCRTVIGLLGLLLMILLSGYLFIYNTLYLSIAKDIRYYGQLKTIGMTSKQLKRMVYRQALWNSYMGIPIGLIVGIFTSRGVIPSIIEMSNPSITANTVTQVSPWFYLFAVFFAFLTNMISSKKPASIVAVCSPIEAIRYVSSNKKIKKHKGTDGGLGKMALQNMFRDKKQVVIILLSFAIAVSLFIVVNVVIMGNDAKAVLNKIVDQDIQFINNTIMDGDEQLINNELIGKVKQMEGVEKVGAVTTTEVIIPYQEEVYETYYKDLYNSRYSPGNFEEDMELYKKEPENFLFTTRFVGIDEIEFERINESLGGTLDKKKFENGEIALTLNFFVDGKDEGMSGKNVRFYFPGKEKEQSIQIAAVLSSSLEPAYFSGGYTPELIVSEKYAKKILGETVTELINITYKEPFDKKTEADIKKLVEDEKQISYDSKLDLYSGMKNSETQVKVLGNSIAGIIAFLAILNYINMMAVSVQNRSKEFATLESIGMTGKQQRRILAYEGLGYAIISSIISLIIGTPLSYFVFQNTDKYGIDYKFPFMSNITLILAVLIVCMFIPIVIYKKTQSGSVVERLRESDS